MFTLQVNGMRCGGCARRVSSVVQLADPAAKVDIDLGSGLVRVESGEAPEAMALAITAAGYPASVTAEA